MQKYKIERKKKNTHSKIILSNSHEFQNYRSDILPTELILKNIRNVKTDFFFLVSFPFFLEKNYFLFLFRTNKKNGPDNF